MEQFRSILFFADGARGEKYALGRAIDIARQTGAQLTVMDVVARFTTSNESLQDSIRRLQDAQIKERLGVLTDLVGSQKDVDLQIRVIPGDKDFIEIIRTVVDERFDLLVKSANSHGKLSTVLFGNTDLRLLRQCPCPVWMIKPGRRKTVAKVLAAVDVSRDERAPMQVAERIIDVAVSVASIEGAHLDVVTAYEQPIDATVATPAGTAAYKEIIRTHHELTHRQFERLLKPFRKTELDEHIKNGKPDRVITKFVKDNDIDLLVMGTLSRDGIPGLLIGNTAERVLNEVDCSVLTLKPKGFKTVIAK